MSNIDDESDESRAKRLALQEPLKRMGRMLRDICPPGIGYALWLFDYGEGGHTVYLSSANREDMIKAVKEWLARVDKPRGDE